MTTHNHQKEMEDLIASLSIEEFKNEVELFIREVMYEGFDAKEVIKSINAVASVSTNKKSDIVFMITLAIERGNNISSMIKSMKSDARDKVMKYKNAYNLKDKVGSNKSSLTLSRVVLAYPWFACEVCNMRPKNQLSGLLESGLPGYMTCQAFSSMIPTMSLNPNITNALIDVATAYQVEFSKLINTKFINKSKSEMISECRVYVDTGYQNSHIPQKVRISKLLSWDILKVNGKRHYINVDLKPFFNKVNLSYYDDNNESLSDESIYF